MVLQSEASYATVVTWWWRRVESEAHPRKAREARWWVFMMNRFASSF
jgi:tRNA U38,U39,U40 pseudouridine synthase TruA